MVQRKSLYLAGVLSLFLLSAIGAVSTRVAPAPEAPAATTALAPDPLADPEVQAILAQREAMYRQAIQEANRRLQELTTRLLQTQDAPTPETYPISPELAAGLALRAVPGARVLRAPELVDFQGVVAYEVVLDRGKVYINARTGSVVFNGPAATVVQGSGAGGGHDDDDHEHQGGNDDD